MTKKIVPVTVEASSHPDFDYIAYTPPKPGQMAKRGSKVEVIEWSTDLALRVTERFNAKVKISFK